MVDQSSVVGVGVEEHQVARREGSGRGRSSSVFGTVTTLGAEDSIWTARRDSRTPSGLNVMATPARYPVTMPMKPEQSREPSSSFSGLPTVEP